MDLNRAGTPLLEIVTAPDFRSAEEALLFARTLRGILRFIGVTEGVMQKGHMRFEPNINCRLRLKGGRTALTPIVEIKNLNSFRSLKAAIEFEAREQPLRNTEKLRIGLTLREMMSQLAAPAEAITSSRGVLCSRPRRSPSCNWPRPSARASLWPMPSSRPTSAPSRARAAPSRKTPSASSPSAS